MYRYILYYRTHQHCLLALERSTVVDHILQCHSCTYRLRDRRFTHLQREQAFRYSNKRPTGAVLLLLPFASHSSYSLALFRLFSSFLSSSCPFILLSSLSFCHDRFFCFLPLLLPLSMFHVPHPLPHSKRAIPHAPHAMWDLPQEGGAGPDAVQHRAACNHGRGGARRAHRG